MALRIRIPRFSGNYPWGPLLLRIGLVTIAAVTLVLFTVFSYFYIKYQYVVSDRLKQPIFANTAKIFAAPREVRPGQKLTVRLIANELRSAGYTADGSSQLSQLGTYSEGSQTITVRPGPESFHAQDSAVVHIGSGVVESITDAMGAKAQRVEATGRAVRHRRNRRAAAPASSATGWPGESTTICLTVPPICPWWRRHGRGWPTAWPPMAWSAGGSRWATAHPP